MAATQRLAARRLLSTRLTATHPAPTTACLASFWLVIVVHISPTLYVRIICEGLFLEMILVLRRRTDGAALIYTVLATGINPVDWVDVVVVESY